MKLRSRYVSFVLLIAVLINSCVSLEVNPVSGNKRAFGYSWEEEEKIGAQSDKEITAQYGVYENEELSNYVSALGQEMLEVSHLRREDTPKKFRETEFTFRVLDSPVVNAFALPGGYVYVTRGLLAHLNNEAQLAVVIGHEIGHVAARHASQRAVEQQVGQLAVIGGAVLGESLGYDGQSILQLSSQTAQLMFLKYGRDDERESDALGVEYAAMQNYEAAEGADFFTSLERISEQQGGGIPTLLSSHPDPGEREQTIPQLAEKWREKGYEQTIEDKDEYLNMIEGIMYGQNPREGFERDGTFYHPELAFQFPVPAGFQVINQPSAVILVNEAQDVITQFAIDSENSSPESSVQQFLAQEGITVMEEGSSDINNLNAYQAVASASGQNGNELQLLISAISYDGNIYRFLSYTTASQFEEYNDAFLEIAGGFDSLHDESILNVQPVRLQIRAANRTAAFSSFIPNNLPMNITAEDIAIINQVHMDDTIEEGTRIKIPVQ
ncbi:M48 family metalloprotease [Gracilimonas mengyeensis]|uniref:Zn-dependent protease n=1 Tax=Gracilimonas mengyeensis TaxID=1302730 RepID=A0A521D4J1_9BACT|nr:M48 family metalloprotease [Gracilimonas mengyeensis]SMO66589.1 Putative Zn-dependent protease [Gracilimonas mengyeensis]